jgi:tetratricopeptide (TPR) repeat protein
MVVANLRKALEIYVNLGDRETVVRTANDLTEALFWAGRFQEATETAWRGLNYLQSDVSADRARLFATLGQAHALATAYEPAQEALREALNLASQLSDPKLEAGLLGARSIIISNSIGRGRLSQTGS